MDSQYSQFPDFLAEDSECEIVEEVPQTTTVRAPRGLGFNVVEDNLLISAWLNAGMDPIQGNEQKLSTFWGKITDYYHKYKDFDSDRSQQMLKQRWGKILREINKFSGCLATINGKNESGKTEQDKIAEAKKLFEEQENKRFTLDHAWVLLRHQPKWIQSMQEFDNKKGKKRSNSSTACTHIDIEEDMNTCISVSRPLGRKAEKRKLKETDKLAQIEKLHLEKKERDDKKLQIMKEKVEVDKEKLRVRKLEFESKKIEAEMRIMSMNTSTMNPEERAYYSKLQMKILQGDT